MFRDETAGKTTYGSARFLTIEKKPKDHATFTLDFNKAYNPPSQSPISPPARSLRSRTS